MNDDVVVFCKNHPGLILKRQRSGLDEVEEPVSSRLDMRAVLNVVGRPEPLRRRVVAFIEQGIECLQYDRLILLCVEIAHCFPLLQIDVGRFCCERVHEARSSSEAA